MAFTFHRREREINSLSQLIKNCVYIGKMANLKPIKPTLKEKKRFVVFEVDCDNQARESDVTAAINKAVLDLIGTLGAGKAGVMVLRNLYTGNKGVLKCNNKHVDYIKASLENITTIADKPASVHAIGVSGILKKAKSKFM